MSTMFESTVYLCIHSIYISTSFTFFCLYIVFQSQLVYQHVCISFLICIHPNCMLTILYFIGYSFCISISIYMWTSLYFSFVFVFNLIVYQQVLYFMCLLYLSKSLCISNEESISFVFTTLYSISLCIYNFVFSSHFCIHILLYSTYSSWLISYINLMGYKLLYAFKQKKQLLNKKKKTIHYTS